MNIDFFLFTSAERQLSQAVGNETQHVPNKS